MNTKTHLGTLVIGDRVPAGAVRRLLLFLQAGGYDIELEHGDVEGSRAYDICDPRRNEVSVRGD